MANPVTSERDYDDNGSTPTAQNLALQRGTDYEMAFDSAADYVPDREETGDGVQVGEELAEDVPVVEQDVEVADPGEEKDEEEDGVGDCQGGHVDAAGQATEVSVCEDEEGKDIADQADRDDQGNEVHLEVVDRVPDPV